MRNLTRFKNNAVLNKCYAPNNNVTNHSRENKAAPNKVLRILLKMTLHKLKIYLKANEGKFYHQISLNINEDQLKRFQNTLASSNSPIWINIEKIYLLSLL